MSNPAQVLHNIYADWARRLEDSNGPMTSIVNLDTVAGTQQIAQAARALVAIRDILTRLDAENPKRVAVYWRQYPEWWKPLVSYHGGWSANMAGTGLVSHDHLDEIESFANFLSGKVWEIDPPREDDLRRRIAEARTALEADTHLSPELRGYLHRLLQEIQNALDDDVVGATYDYSDAVARLYVAFKAAEGEDTPSRGTWRTLWTGFISGAAANALVAAAPAAIVAIGQVTGTN